MADIPVLVCTAGPLEGRTFHVQEGGLEIGRAPDNDVVLLDDPAVSRFHARLLYDHGSLWLQDAGSRNGVFLNGDRLTQSKDLRVGDVVKVGASQFEVAWDTDQGLVASSATSEAVRTAEADARSGAETVVEDAPEADRPSKGAGDAPKKRRWYWPFD